MSSVVITKKQVARAYRPNNQEVVIGDQPSENHVVLDAPTQPEPIIVEPAPKSAPIDIPKKESVLVTPVETCAPQTHNNEACAVADPVPAAIDQPKKHKIGEVRFKNDTIAYAGLAGIIALAFLGR